MHLLLPILTAGLLVASDPVATPSQRTFEFSYSASWQGLPVHKKVRIWIPVPANSTVQQVRLLRGEFRGATQETGRVAVEATNGNLIRYAECLPDADGKISLQFDYRITRREVLGSIPLTEEDTKRLPRLLQADTLVPIRGKPLDLLVGKSIPENPLERGRMLYNLVLGHVRYYKQGQGWGRGDSVWVCDSRFGNCSDFHSLFLSLARSQKLPARFEMGFSIPEQAGEGEIGGYHCWAFFRPGEGGWVPVDISEASKEPKRREYYFGNLTADRVTFSHGRDIELIPRQAGAPLNYFIYPYAESDNEPVSTARMSLRFRYRDLK